MYLIFLISLIKFLIFFSWAIILSSTLAYFFTAYYIYFSIFNSFFIINMRLFSSSSLMTFNAQFICCTSVKTVSSFRVFILFWCFSSNVVEGVESSPGMRPCWKRWEAAELSCTRTGQCLRVIENVYSDSTNNGRERPATVILLFFAYVLLKAPLPPTQKKLVAMRKVLK